jgi:hypothetical protein
VVILPCHWFDLEATIMFEDFRKQVEDAALAAETQEEEPVVEVTPEPEGYFLGMTPMQRFIVAVLLLFMIIILGGLFLVVTLKVNLHF